MADQEQRIVLTYDEAGTRAKLEQLNKAFEQQEKVVEKDTQALGQLSLEFDKATKAANTRQMDLFNRSLATTSTTAKQLGFDFKAVTTEITKASAPKATLFDNIVKGGNLAKAGLLGVNEAILSFTRSYGAATAGLAAGVYTVTQGFDALFTALDRGQVLNDLERSFEAIKEGTGATQVSLQGLQQATFGLLDSTTLLTQANTAMTLGLPGDELEDLYQKTIQLARAQGVDAIRAIESITIGIARQSKLYLDNLGILIDLEKAQAKYAAANNTTTEALTDQQKQAAFYQATQEALNAKVKQTADVMLTAAERSQQFRVRLSDLVAEFGQGITQSTALGDAFAGIGSSLDSISFEQLGKSAGDLAAVFVNSVLPPLTRTATLLEFINNFKLSIPDVENFDFGVAEFILPGSGKIGAGIEKGIGAITGWMAEYNKSIADARETSAKEFQLLQNVITEGFDSLSLHPATGASPLAALDQLDEKTKKALESFKKLDSEADLKNLKQQIDNAITGEDQNIFSRLVPQLEAEFKKVRTEELTNQLKEGVQKGLITAEDIAKTVNAEWTVTAGELQGKMTKALDDTAKKGADTATKIRDEFAQADAEIDFDNLQTKLEQAIEVGDQGGFNQLIAQMEDQFKSARFDELKASARDALGTGVTEAQIAERVNKEWDQTKDGFVRSMREGVSEAEQELRSLQSDLKWDELQSGLERSISTLDRGAFDVISQEMEAQFKRVRFDELRQELSQTIGDPVIWDIVNREWAQQAKEMAGEWSKALNDQFQESTDFFGELLEGLFDGGDLEDTIKDMLKRAAIDFGSQLLAQLTGNFSLQSLGLGTGGQMNYLGLLSSLFGGGSAGGGGGFSAVQQAQGVYDIYSTAGSIFGLGGAGAAGSGSLGGAGTGALAGISVGGIAATAGAAAAAYFAYEGFKSAKDLTEKPRDQFSRDDAVQVGSNIVNPGSLIAYGIGDVFGIDQSTTRAFGKFDPRNWGIELLDSLGVDMSFLNFGSGKDLGQRKRDGVRDFLFDQGVIGDPDEAGPGGRKAEFNLFGGGYGSLSPGTEYQGLAEGAGQFAGLGNLLSFATTGGIDVEVAGMFANALTEAESFNAAVLTTSGLLDQLGLDAETVGQALLDSYLNGETGLSDLNAQLNTLTAVMANDLPSAAEGFDLLADSLDDPRSAIQAFGLTLQELNQEGKDTTEELTAAFAERFGPEAAAAFQGIFEAGITSLDALNNASVPQLQVIVNELDAVAQSQGVTVEAVRQYGDESEKAGEKSSRALQKERAEIERNTRAYGEARREKQRYFSEGSTDSFGTGPNGGV